MHAAGLFINIVDVCGLQAVFKKRPCTGQTLYDTVHEALSTQHKFTHSDTVLAIKLLPVFVVAEMWV